MPIPHKSPAVTRAVEYSRDALTALRRMDRATARRIVAKVEQLAVDPASLANNVKALKGGGSAPLMRLRVGDWRVIYRDGLVIAVVRIAARGSAYN